MTGSQTLLIYSSPPCLVLLSVAPYYNIKIDIQYSVSRNLNSQKINKIVLALRLMSDGSRAVFVYFQMRMFREGEVLIGQSIVVRYEVKNQTEAC